MYANKMSKDKVKAGMRCPTSKKKTTKQNKRWGERERDVYSSSLKLPYKNVIDLSEVSHPTLTS